jgi:hypothetical protein
MSLTYHAKKRSAQIPDFDANVCGCLLLGHINRVAGARMSKSPLCELAGLRPAYTATAEEAAADAWAIARTPDEQIKALMDNKDVRYCNGGDAEDLVAFARDWQAFLAQCGGYHTDPDDDWYDD